MNSINKIPAPYLKICGLTRSEDVSVCERYGVDFIGINFSPASKRRVSLESAASLVDHQEKSQVVGLFVDQELEEIEAVCKSVPRLTIIQLHGHESAEFASQVRAATGKKVWKALQITGPEDIINAVDEWEGTVDLILLDGRHPGTGTEFEWQWLAHVKFATKWGIAGGISPKNIAQALEHKPTLVDIASGVESAPGIKDPTLIANCMDTLKAAREV